MKCARTILAVAGLLVVPAGCRREVQPPPPPDAALPDAYVVPPPDAFFERADVGELADAVLPPGDSDGDGIADADERARGTDVSNPDTDGDGFGDGVEVLAGTDPTDRDDRIPDTDFYVVLPFMESELHRPLEFRARLGRADIFFLVDTTGSMAGAISNVTASLSTVIIPGVNGSIADAVMGVGDYRDFPVGGYGAVSDWSFQVRQVMTSDVAAVQAALRTLRAGGGGDNPESATEGLFRSVAGTDCADGFGEACFRATSHPILVLVTDAQFHNGPDSTHDYSSLVAAAREWDETLAALDARSVRVVGVAVDSGPVPLPLTTPVPSEPDLTALATATGSRSSSGRLTVFRATSGAVSTSVVEGIIDLVGAETQDVSAIARDDDTDAIDATQFILGITPLSATRATRFDETTFFGVAGGTTVTFDVTFRNRGTPAGDHVQIHRAFIEVVDVNSGLTLDRRNVYIVIPREDGGLI